MGSVRTGEGFNGAAMILRGRYFDPVWWQPPADIVPEALRGMREWVMERLEYGYSLVGVEYRGETAWIGGCDDVYPELVEEQAWEVLAGAVEQDRARLVARIEGREVVPV